MLGKLLKYEIPALGRKLLPLYIGWAATAALLGIMIGPLEGKSEFMMVISALLYTCATTAIFVMAVIVMIQRYKNSLLGDEGYFNHVLPVTASSHIASKMIASMIWILISFAALMITGLIIAIFSGGITELFSLDWKEFFSDLFMIFSGKTVVAIIEFLLLALCSLTQGVLAIYAAITIGHQARTRTTLAAIGAYFGIMTLESFAGRIVYGIVGQNYLGFDKITDFASYQWFILPGFAVSILLSVVYFFICKELMEKKLNLA